MNYCIDVASKTISLTIGWGCGTTKVVPFQSNEINKSRSLDSLRCTPFAQDDKC